MISVMSIMRRFLCLSHLKQVLAVIGKQTKVGADSGGASGGRGCGAGGPAGRGPARHTSGGGSYKNSKSTTPTLTTFKIFIKLLFLIHRKNILLFKRKVQEWGRVPLLSLV